MDGRVAVVIGAGHWIGAACACPLGETGATIIITDHNPALVQSSVAALKAVNIDAFGAVMDVTKIQTGG